MSEYYMRDLLGPRPHLMVDPVLTRRDTIPSLPLGDVRARGVFTETVLDVGGGVNLHQR